MAKSDKPKHERSLSEGRIISELHRHGVYWKAVSPTLAVMPGLDPGIHVFAFVQKRGWPGRARP